MFNIKILSSILIVLVIASIYTWQNNDTEEVTTTVKEGIPEYKTVFITQKVESKMEVIEDANNIKSIDKDVDTLISEADLFMETHNLTLPTPTLSDEQQQKNQDLDEELKAFQLELEELSHEG